MQAIGITGGIGSGKSITARLLKRLGYPVYIADTEAARLIAEHPQIRLELTRLCGEDIYQGNALNKARLADIIFHNREALEKVNRIVHPRVMEDFQSWCRRQANPCVFFESAILFEAQLARFFDAVICVTAPEEIRISRVSARDHTTPEKVRERMCNQWNDQEKCRQADFLIYNDNRRLLLVQLLDILEKIKNNLISYRNIPANS